MRRIIPTDEPLRRSACRPRIIASHPQRAIAPRNQNGGSTFQNANGADSVELAGDCLAVSLPLVDEYQISVKLHRQPQGFALALVQLRYLLDRAGNLHPEPCGASGG